MAAGIPEICGEQSADSERVRLVLDRMSDKWSLFVIATLERTPLRFTEVRRAIPGISHRMLTVTLRSLERDGLVSRRSFDESPPRVEYSVTDLGRTLIPPALELVRWAFEHQAELQAHRDAFDEARDAGILARVASSGR